MSKTAFVTCAARKNISRDIGRVLQMNQHFAAIRKALAFLYNRAPYVFDPGYISEQADAEKYAQSAMRSLEELEKEGEIRGDLNQERFEVKVGKSFVHKVNGGEKPSVYRIVLASKQGDEVTFIGQLEKHNTEAETDTDKELRSRQGGLAREPEDLPFMGLLGKTKGRSG